MHHVHVYTERVGGIRVVFDECGLEDKELEKALQTQRVDDVRRLTVLAHYGNKVPPTLLQMISSRTLEQVSFRCYHGRAWTSILPALPRHLVELELCHTPIGDEGAIIIARNLPMLHSLVLSECQLTNAGVAAIFNSDLHNTLHTLALSYNDIDIMPADQPFPALENLRLTKTKLSVAACQHMAWNFPRLRRLILAFLNVPPPLLSQFLRPLHQCRSLQYLECFYHNPVEELAEALVQSVGETIRDIFFQSFQDQDLVTLVEGCSELENVEDIRNVDLEWRALGCDNECNSKQAVQQYRFKHPHLRLDKELRLLSKVSEWVVEEEEDEMPSLLRLMINGVLAMDTLVRFRYAKLH